ncbi:hypothetical protein C8Q80DRAFT_543583 [Daedaleopsis nitida]|nr:hypothetical protein C8Q80DRAFT_543583 [Daedaleopsis nitida]
MNRPPPPYSACNGPASPWQASAGAVNYGSSNISETGPLLGTQRDCACCRSESYYPFSLRKPTLLRLFAAIFLLFVVIGQNTGVLPTMVDDLSASEKMAIRKEWRLEESHHLKERQRWKIEQDDLEDRFRRTKESFGREQVAQKKEREKWQHERDEERQKWKREEEKQRTEEEKRRRAFEREQEEWAREREEEEHHRKEMERKRQGVWWSEPWKDNGCHAYGSQSYSAHLWDIPGGLNWHEVCMDMPIRINGRWVDRPNKCSNDGHHIWGTWFINFDEPQCATRWEDMRDLVSGRRSLYCLHNPLSVTCTQGCNTAMYGTRRFKARLTGLRHGDDWDMMCKTTPANIRGVYYEHPTHCDDMNGRTGYWDHPDRRCVY